jgi:hypothetical protein
MLPMFDITVFKTRAMVLPWTAMGISAYILYLHARWLDGRDKICILKSVSWLDMWHPVSYRHNVIYV